MSSVVVELQRESLDRNVPISDLLRKALVVAKKLKISDFEKWVANELNGYEKGEDIPKYREIIGTIKAWNPYHGWQPVIFSTPSKEESLSQRPCSQSIAEIESLVNEKSDGSCLAMPFPAAIEQQLRRGISFNTQITLIVPSTYLVRIIDAVRTIVLNWSLKLEEDGILGEGMSFTPSEKETAEKMSYNINNFYGPVLSPQIQQHTSNSLQISTTKQFDLSELRSFIEELRQQLGKLNLERHIEQELQAEVTRVEAQLSSPKPKEGVIRESLSSIKRMLEGAGGALVAQLLLRLGSLF